MQGYDALTVAWLCGERRQTRCTCLVVPPHLRNARNDHSMSRRVALQEGAVRRPPQLLTCNFLKEYVSERSKPYIDSLFNSPAFHAFKTGHELSSVELSYMMKQYYHYVKTFPVMLSYTISLLPEDETRMLLVGNLWAEHGFGDFSRNHRQLYQNFLEGIAEQNGSPLEDIFCEPGPAVSRFVENNYNFLHSHSAASALGMLGPGVEEMTPPLFSKILDCVKQTWPQSSDKTLEFLDLHIKLDIDHGDEFWEVISTFLQTQKDGALDTLVEGVKFAVVQENMFWNALLSEAKLAVAKDRKEEGMMLPMTTEIQQSLPPAMKQAKL